MLQSLLQIDQANTSSGMEIAHFWWRCGYAEICLITGGAAAVVVGERLSLVGEQREHFDLGWHKRGGVKQRC